MTFILTALQGLFFVLSVLRLWLSQVFWPFWKLTSAFLGDPSLEGCPEIRFVAQPVNEPTGSANHGVLLGAGQVWTGFVHGAAFLSAIMATRIARLAFSSATS